MPRWEVVDLALPSVEDQNLDGALAAEPRHHRLRADLACPARHEGPGDPRAVRDVRLSLLPAAERHPRRAGRGRLRPARRQASPPPPRPSPAGPLRSAVRRGRNPGAPNPRAGGRPKPPGPGGFPLSPAVPGGFPPGAGPGPGGGPPRLLP